MRPTRRGLSARPILEQKLPGLARRRHRRRVLNNTAQVLFRDANSAPGSPDGCLFNPFTIHRPIHP